MSRTHETGRRAGPRRSRRAGVAGRAAALVFLLVASYLAVTFVQVWTTARRDDTRPAQAIVVLGAAQYQGRPSPVLRARLDHAARLYREGLAPVVVVTGGQRPGDTFSEARSSAQYLQSEGVPDAALRWEVSGRSSYESLAASARFLRAEGITEVLLVSDPWHSRRIAEIAAEVGLDAYPSPTPDSPYGTVSSLRRMARETLAVAVGRLIGYRRLERFN